ncbi:MAG: hypothetical protein ACOC49_04005 [Candidatus Bipolaricaulota bacterium]
MLRNKLKKSSVFILAFLLYIAGAVPVVVHVSSGARNHQPITAYAVDGDSRPSTPKAETSSSDKLSEWKTFRSEEEGFEFSYPPAGKVQTYSSKERKIVKVNLPVPSGSLLQEKLLLIKVKKDFERYVNGLSDPESHKTVYINGRKFVKEKFEEGATGDIYEHTVYSTKQGNRFFVLDFVLHSTNPEIYESPPPDFDRSEADVFRKILGTFRFFRFN